MGTKGGGEYEALGVKDRRESGAGLRGGSLRGGRGRGRRSRGAGGRRRADGCAAPEMGGWQRR